MSDGNSRRWYVVQSSPRQVRRADTNLRNQGYTTYLPEWRVERIYKSKRVENYEPLFPNYVFIRLQLGWDNWAPIRSTRGVLRLVALGTDPTPVADGVIKEIRSRTTELEKRPVFLPGDYVEITRGIFRGLEAIFRTFDSDERAVLFLNILEQQVKASISLSDIRHK